MNVQAATNAPAQASRSAVEIARELGPVFAARADATVDEDKYVADNIALLKTSGLVEAGVPRELGGGGADVDQLAAMLRIMGYHCGSTALVFSMHTHQVAIPAWRWTHQKVAAAEPLLKRIANERILILSSGGSDWIAGSGKAEKVDGGYRITARKIFTSGAATGDILMTGAVLEADGEPPMVLHFGIPMNSPHVKVLDTWRVLGKRGIMAQNDVADRRVRSCPRQPLPCGARRANGTCCFRSSAPSLFRSSTPSIWASPGARATLRSASPKRKNTGSARQSILRGAWRRSGPRLRLAHELMLAAVRLNAPSASDDQRCHDRTTARGATRDRRRRIRHGVGRRSPDFIVAAGLQPTLPRYSGGRAIDPLEIRRRRRKYAGVMALGSAGRSGRSETSIATGRALACRVGTTLNLHACAIAGKRSRPARSRRSF